MVVPGLELGPGVARGESFRHYGITTVREPGGQAIDANGAGEPQPGLSEHDARTDR